MRNKNLCQILGLLIGLGLIAVGSAKEIPKSNDEIHYPNISLNNRGVTELVQKGLENLPKNGTISIANLKRASFLSTKSCPSGIIVELQISKRELDMVLFSERASLEPNMANGLPRLRATFQPGVTQSRLSTGMIITEEAWTARIGQALLLVLNYLIMKQL